MRAALYLISPVPVLIATDRNGPECGMEAAAVPTAGESIGEVGRCGEGEAKQGP